MEEHHTLHPSIFSQMSQLINHPSHPVPGHSLLLLPTPIYPSGMFTCNGCGHAGHRFNYHCTGCNFDLHVLCALNPAGPPALQPQTWSTTTNYSFPGPNHQYQATAPSQSGIGWLRALFEGFGLVADVANLHGQDFVQSIINEVIGDPGSIVDLLLGFGN